MNSLTVNVRADKAGKIVSELKELGASVTINKEGGKDSVKLTVNYNPNANIFPIINQ